MKIIPQFKPFLGTEEILAVQKCITDNWITEGPKSQEFLNIIKNLTQAKYAVLAPNGTLAIYLALVGCGIGNGDEVLVPDFTFIATANAVVMAGAKPIFVDVDDNLHISLQDAKNKITPKTKAILPVHMYGTACNMSDVISFSKNHNLIVIEDAAQAIGVKWDNKHAGTFGKAGTFSFFADKTITTGEGGAVVTDDEDVYNKLLLLRNQGRINRGSFIHPELGYNFRMTDIQTSIGVEQFKKLDFIIKTKLEIFEKYKVELGSTVKILEPDSRSTFVPFRVAIILDKDSKPIMEFMSSKNIETRTFFYPLHLQPCYQNLNQKCLNSVSLYSRGICLPAFVEISDDEIKRVSETLLQGLNVR